MSVIVTFYFEFSIRLFICAGSANGFLIRLGSLVLGPSGIANIPFSLSTPISGLGG